MDFRQVFPPLVRLYDSTEEQEEHYEQQISDSGRGCLGLFIPIGRLSSGTGGEFVGAEWGVPGSRVDVTARVRTFVHDGVLQLEVTRFNLGIDPAPHQNKTLIIRVRHWDGDVREYSYPERSTVNLELDPENRGEWREEHAREERREEHDRDDRREERYEHRERGLQILRAYYGAEGQFINERTPYGTGLMTADCTCV